MCCENEYPLKVYLELEPLCRKGHVVLVQNQQNGQLYVKKRIQSYAPELYRQLRENPVKNTPVLYGIYEDTETTAAPDAVPLILIEEYLPGHTLSEQIQENGLLSEDRCIDIGMQICRILMELHSRKPAIIHRDIKPSNVMLLPDGSVELIDFSAAKNASGGEKQDTVLLGTAGFAAPEQYGFSASTPQTDLYALGVLLNIMLTGTFPWERQTDGRFRGIIARCLKMEQKKRYAGAWELYAALKQARCVRIPWLPPGFRTLRWFKMIPAALWYLFVFIFTFRVKFDDATTPDVRSCTYIVFLLLGLLPVLFYTNYLNIQRFFPLMRSSSHWLRLLGLMIAPVFLILLILGIAVITVIVGIFADMILLLC